MYHGRSTGHRNESANRSSAGEPANTGAGAYYWSQLVEKGENFPFFSPDRFMPRPLLRPDLSSSRRDTNPSSFSLIIPIRKRQTTTKHDSFRRHCPYPRPVCPQRQCLQQCSSSHRKFFGLLRWIRIRSTPESFCILIDVNNDSFSHLLHFPNTSLFAP